ncbi:MAG: nucleotide exchange factor GrpE [Acidobacteria bacterium]|nr:nucleotide exchange factor GrpE [Acidobacteriota bacterium]
MTAESPEDTRARPDAADTASELPPPADADDVSRAGAGGARAGEACAQGDATAEVGAASEASGAAEPIAAAAEAPGAAEPIAAAAEPEAAVEPDAVEPDAAVEHAAVEPDAAVEHAAAEPDVTVEPDAAAQRDEYYDLLLRKTAEFDNYRKRVERERAALASAAAADLIEELLPVIDNLERALEAPVAEASAAAYRDGVELIHRQMLDLLRKRGVTPIETAGQVFDPNLHQAIAHEESGEHGPGDIIGEVRRGYLVGSRLLRASMVRVAKA